MVWMKIVLVLDCSSPDAPYCSSWGWCQWTSKHGVHGPSEIVQVNSGHRLLCRSERGVHGPSEIVQVNSGYRLLCRSELGVHGPSEIVQVINSYGLLCRSERSVQVT